MYFNVSFLNSTTVGENTDFTFFFLTYNFSFE